MAGGPARGESTPEVLRNAADSFHRFFAGRGNGKDDDSGATMTAAQAKKSGAQPEEQCT